MMSVLFDLKYLQTFRNAVTSTSTSVFVSRQCATPKRL